MNPLITVIGPTAIGKSDLAVRIALHIEKTYGKKAEIISTDSRQVYKYLDIGTGKITKEEMCGIPHHMIDIIEPKDSYSVFHYAKDVKRILQDIYTRGAIPILCGGTGFYIDAIIFGNIGTETPAYIDEQNILEALPLAEIKKELQVLSEKTKADISHVDITNKRRIARAITILRHGGTFAKKNTTPLFNLLQIGLDTSTEHLRERIQKRLDARLDNGMIEESEKLLAENTLTHERMQKLGLEYKFISDYVRDKLRKEEFKERLFFAIWHYAKRQRMWFKKYTGVHWFEAEEIKENHEPVFTLINDFCKHM